MPNISPQIESSWKEILKEEFKSPYFAALKQFLVQEKIKETVYPPGNQIFSAFNFTPFENVRVVIIGQDPYHGEGQAHGLCFSVPKNIKKPPSLLNIFKEIKNDLGYEIPQHGNLEKWAKQGVLLINATLTVRANQAGSHQKKGWETFTDAVIRKLSNEKEHLVFLLWGNFAIKKKELIDQSKHYILSSVHPSPLSASRGFMGNKHFSKTNQILRNFEEDEINWKID